MVLLFNFIQEKMKNTVLFIFWSFYMLVLGTACSETDLNSPKVIGNKPDPVTEYEVESLNGGAKINFKMPASDDLLYVKAEYTLASGQKRETRSSLYKNYLTVDGFEKAGQYDITLYAVAKGEVFSDPTTVTINALTPPYLLTRESIGLIATFGGVNISFKNEAKADLSIQLIEKNEKGAWVEKYTHYTNAEKSDFSVRGYEPETREFGVCVKDRFGNLSDTLFKACTPIYEELIPKNTWQKFSLPDDQNESHPGYTQWRFERMWDNSLGGDNMFHTGNLLPVWPAPFTIDLGHAVSFSRMKLFQRQSSLYASNNVRIFEVYGSNNPNLDGSWDSWTLMGSFEVIKPSGSSGTTVTGEDKTVAQNGHEFEFSPLLPSFRYIRFRILESWGKMESIAIAEITFWGKVED